jgi:hypothetical protein
MDIKKIIEGPEKMNNIIITAQTLTNNEFDRQKDKILKIKHNSNLHSDLEYFRSVIKNTLSSEDAEELLKLNDNRLYNFARKIVLEFMKKEIKTF